ncbi:cytochrome P450 [Pyxidicoccus fallax]|uniref:Cytochrome P450 n=1 Tax=Pyxidicoccus fallax TaxID=394095 RepID=A0A848LER9_9BACT|nr:cytochrome P450 [Pyxidicoccus fallax]NMO16752.1 cytochrome P450 [Pyxidicoccus fallax]NPC77855.1 cytochrome P450 [Pyxidicoccus fallax]
MQTYDLFAPTNDAERHALYARMRAEPGLFRIEPFGAYAAARYEDVRTLFKDAQRFSSEALAVTAEPPWLGPNPVAQSLLTQDPPRHTQLRALVSRAFGAAGMARLEAQVRQEAETLAEAAVRQREVDFVDAFSFVLPRNIIGRMLGLDPSTFTEFKRWSVNMSLISSAVPSQHQGIRDTVKEMEAYLGDIIAARRRAPGDDMVSDLLRAEVDGRQLTDAEVMSFLFLLLPAGMETTTQLIGNAAILLARFPEQLAQARADRTHLPRFVEEVLRYESPVQFAFRIAIADVELSGTQVPAGSLVMGLVAAANRDERVFEQPERFLPGRDKGNQHLTFGHGVHFCLGAQLARMEARFALEALVPRIREIRLRSPDIQWLPGLTIHGPQVLPVDLVPA